MLNKPRFRSLSAKFPITITVIAACVGFTIGAAVIVQDWLRFREALEEKALLLARSIAVAAPEAILQNDSWSLYKNLRKMTLREPDGMPDTRILSGMVLNPDGVILAHLDPAAHPIGLVMSPQSERERRVFDQALRATAVQILRGGTAFNQEFIEGVVPVYADEKKIGIVFLRLSTADLYSQAGHAALTVFGITAALVLAGSLFGGWISRRMTQPLTALAAGMESVGRGDFSDLPVIDTRKSDEIGLLAASFNRMAAELDEKRQLEKEAAANEKTIALGRIAAGVAHEVNNPLAGILNCLDTIKKHPDDGKLINRYLPIIETGLNRIRLIVASLLGELRVEGSQELAGPACLDDLRDVALMELNGKPILLNWENSLTNEVMLNRQRVQQVVLNLLKNAFQALPDEGTVSFRAFQVGEILVLEVEDDGPGIDESHIGQLFDPFFTTRSDGTGLGLWITYRLVRSMQGEIEVASDYGNGTKFQVLLPPQMKPPELRQFDN
jgi:signal transduction histidine kinase